MLFNYFLLMVVEIFCVFEGLYFGWIDLGLGCVLGID